MYEIKFSKCKKKQKHIIEHYHWESNPRAIKDNTGKLASLIFFKVLTYNENLNQMKRYWEL